MLFMTNTEVREGYGNAAPAVVWLNLSSKDEVDDLHERWRRGRKLPRSRNHRRWTAPAQPARRFESCQARQSLQTGEGADRTSEPPADI